MNTVFDEYMYSLYVVHISIIYLEIIFNNMYNGKGNVWWKKISFIDFKFRFFFKDEWKSFFKHLRMLSGQ